VAIPQGALWESEIRKAIAESVFFIPIVTPVALGSKHCRFEFESFLNREASLDRNNLVFPLLYVRVPALEREELWRQDNLLKIVGARQYIDWQRLRHRGFADIEVAEKVELFCKNIVDALRQPWKPAAPGLDLEEAMARLDHPFPESSEPGDASAKKQLDTTRKSSEARAKLLRGVDAVANAVRIALGPKGRSVILRRSNANRSTTRDGKTIADQIELEDWVEDAGAQMVREAASKTSKVAGDGTKTAIVLAWAIIMESAKAIAAGASPFRLKQGIDDAVAAVLADIRENAVKVTRGKKLPRLVRALPLKTSGSEGCWQTS
jgi:hypothetical protein